MRFYQNSMGARGRRAVAILRRQVCSRTVGKRNKLAKTNYIEGLFCLAARFALELVLYAAAAQWVEARGLWVTFGGQTDQWVSRKSHRDREYE